MTSHFERCSAVSHPHSWPRPPIIRRSADAVCTVPGSVPLSTCGPDHASHNSLQSSVQCLVSKTWYSQVTVSHNQQAASSSSRHASQLVAQQADTATSSGREATCPTTVTQQSSYPHKPTCVCLCNAELSGQHAMLDSHIYHGRVRSARCVLQPQASGLKLALSASVYFAFSSGS